MGRAQRVPTRINLLRIVRYAALLGSMALRVINLESGMPSLEEARRRLLVEMQAARKQGVRVLKIIHGYGSSGADGVLCIGIRKSLRLRIKEGKAVAVIYGERFSSDANETRELLERHPS